jgi:extracellular factor (EF) 3-hydroxypalmitic acid methyl ester biosynthesis protein
MVLGPGWNPPPAGYVESTPEAPGDPSGVARDVANYLVDRLRWAKGHTGGWADEELSIALVDATINDCLARLAATGCWGEANRLPSAELWRIAHPWLKLGWLQNRARSKPRGYAGDFGLVTRICRRYHAPHPLGRAFDRYFHRQAAAEAVRARTEQVAAALVEHRLAATRSEYQAVSVGAGPALDVQLALSLLPADRRPTLQVTLLDLDPAALRFAGRQLAPFCAAHQVQCRRENLYRLAHPAKAAALPQQIDFLICTGLFDYLPDDPAIEMLRLFWSRLRPGGRMLVGNFAPHCPTRAYMEWGANWYLIYRNAAELDRLARAAGIPADQFRIGAEWTGVDLFIIADRCNPA